jgi:DUF971 family protein
MIPVGNYAVRLMFDDLHSTGVFGWDYLRATSAATGKNIW